MWIFSSFRMSKKIFTHSFEKKYFIIDFYLGTVFINTWTSIHTSGFENKKICSWIKFSAHKNTSLRNKLNQQDTLARRKYSRIRLTTHVPWVIRRSIARKHFQLARPLRCTYVDMSAHMQSYRVCKNKDQYVVQITHRSLHEISGLFFEKFLYCVATICKFLDKTRRIVKKQKALFTPCFPGKGSCMMDQKIMQ